MDAKFNSMDAKFDSIDTKFNRMDAKFDSIDTKFNSMDAKFDSMDAKIDSKHEHLVKKIDHLTITLGGSHEKHSARWLGYCMKLEGIENPQLFVNEKIPDPEGVVHSSNFEIEIDVISYAHHRVMECTTVLQASDGLKKLEKFARKCEFLKAEYGDGQPFKAYFTAYKIDEAIEPQARAFMAQNDIEFVPDVKLKFAKKQKK